jgi:hypothetical protein
MRATSPGRPSGSAAWVLRFAGFNALVNSVGFGAFDVLGTWHLAHDHVVWHAAGNPTYGYGEFQAHGLPTTVPLLLAFLGSCFVLAVGGGLLLVPRRAGVVTTLAGIVMCAPFWWGFNLPLAWINAATVLVLLLLAWGASMSTRTGRADAGSLETCCDLSCQLDRVQGQG